MASSRKSNLALPGDGMAFGLEWGEFLQKLRNELQLDASTDLLAGSLLTSSGAWVTPTVSAPWTASYIQYIKDPLGFVHLRGAASAPAAQTNVAMFTLPAGFRPGITDYYLCLMSGAAAGAYAHIDTAGVVQGSIPAAGQLWLNSISFLAEN